MRRVLAAVSLLAMLAACGSSHKVTISERGRVCSRVASETSALPSVTNPDPKRIADVEVELHSDASQTSDPKLRSLVTGLVAAVDQLRVAALKKNKEAVAVAEGDFRTAAVKMGKACGFNLTQFVGTP